MQKLPAKVKLIDRRQMSNEEWKANRSTYIGGSEVGTILGLNEYESSLELFHRKIGIIPSNKPEVLSTYAGHVMEEVIYKNFWKYYDPTNPEHQRLVDNATADREMRVARRFNYTIISEEYPWLAANLDYIIQKNKYTPAGILDCKNSLKWVMAQYIGGVHPHYIGQMQDYMLVTGFDYAELCFLQDGRYPEVFPIKASETIQLEIIKSTKDFWERILAAREIWEDESMSQDVRLHRIEELEPDIDASNSLERYLKERHTLLGKAGRMVGTNEILEIAVAYLKAHASLGPIEEEKRLQGNVLRKMFTSSGVDEIMFGDKTLISYRKNEKGVASLKVSDKLLEL